MRDKLLALVFALLGLLFLGGGFWLLLADGVEEAMKRVLGMVSAVVIFGGCAFLLMADNARR